MFFSAQNDLAFQNITYLGKIYYITQVLDSSMHRIFPKKFQSWDCPEYLATFYRSMLGKLPALGLTKRRVASARP